MENKGENPFQAQVRETRTAINELTKEISAFERELVAHKGDACNIEKAIAFKTERLKMLYEEIASLMEKQAAHQSSVDAAMKRAGYNVAECAFFAIGLSARTTIETFCRELEEKHDSDKSFITRCGRDLTMYSNPRILEHFYECQAVPLSDKTLLRGCSLGDGLPTSGCLAEVYEAVRQIISTTRQTSDDGRVLVPGDMLSAEKRFFIKLLLAEGREVAIVDRNGTLRVPHFDEIVTPPDTPPDVPRVGVVRKRDNQSKKGEEKSEKKGEKKHRR